MCGDSAGTKINTNPGKQIEGIISDQAVESIYVCLLLPLKFNGNWCG